jgi:predicted aldo/keto reductase-like oxidoreductase
VVQVDRRDLRLLGQEAFEHAFVRLPFRPRAEGKVWPEAAKKGVALAAMKVYGGAPGGEKKPKGARLPDDFLRSALRYALGLPQVSVAVVGIHDEQELQQNLEWARDYKPLTAEELLKLDEPSRELASKWKAVYGPVT